MASDIVLHEAQMPPLDAAGYRSFGDDLLALVRGDWPAPPEGTTASVKRVDRSGTRTRGFLVDRPGARSAQIWRCVGDAWVLDDVPSPHGSKEACGSPQWFFEVRPGVSYEFNAPGLDITERLVLLEPTIDEDPREWEGEDADTWASEDALLHSCLQSVEWRRRWVSINDDRAIPVVVGSGKSSFVAFLQIDMSELEFRSQGTLAEWSWFSESGDGPISWDGGSRVVRVSPQVLAFQRWGDDASDLLLRAAPSTDTGLAQALAAWITKEGALFALAVECLEFDGRGTLEPGERERWEELLTAPELWLTLSVPTSVRDLVRDVVATDHPQFRALAEAFDDPCGSRGAALRAVLEDYESDGVIGPLRWGLDLG